MFSRRLLVAVLSAVLLTDAGISAQGSGEEAAVRAAVQQYLKGHATGSADEMRQAFLPTAHIEGIRNGTFTSWTAEEYASRFTGKPAADEATRKRTIDSVNVSGTAAMARATLVHGATTFVDYFVLLKVDGQWKIANKVYTAVPTKQ
jgi:Putative lumazine-binding